MQELLKKISGLRQMTRREAHDLSTGERVFYGKDPRFDALCDILEALVDRPGPMGPPGKELPEIESCALCAHFDKTIGLYGGCVANSTARMTIAAGVSPSRSHCLFVPSLFKSKDPTPEDQLLEIRKIVRAYIDPSAKVHDPYDTLWKILDVLGVDEALRRW